MQKRIAILGSTGSIGTQTLDIIAEHPDRFAADVLTANSNYTLLAEQAMRFKPRKVVIADERHLTSLRGLLSGSGIEVEGGNQAIQEAGCNDSTEIVMASMVGYSGLLPTVNAIRAGKTIALANKETLVAGGSVIMPLAREYGVKILPVDSEHSAIFQCLNGEERRKLNKILLTASGGPFRTTPLEQMGDITVEQALNHPNWKMGSKVTIDSATMMNKGFEMMEASWLFDCEPERIQVLVHPQSILHSAVEFIDGSIIAQLGTPDMHTPIRYALGYPERLEASTPKMTVSQISRLTFEEPDMRKFPLLQMAFDVMKAGGNLPAALNAANEVAVKAFLNRRLPFMKMSEVAASTMAKITKIEDPSLEDIIATHHQATSIAMEMV